MVGKVIPRDVNALDMSSELFQQAFPSQCVAASGSDQSHGKGIRLQFLVARVSTAQAVAGPPCSARRWRHSCRRFAAAKEKERRL